MEVKIEKRRLSLITDIIIFLLLLNIFLFGFRYISYNFNLSQNLSLEDIEISNKNYIESNNIKEKYGINILYGDKSYETVLKVNAVVQEDEYKIYDNLIEIEKSLQKYPDNFFKNNNLTIILLDHFANNNIALASRNKLNEFKIYISNNANFERALHHEMYHIFEYKLNIIKSDAFSNWSKLNPENFKYTPDTKSLDDKYIYKSYSDQSEAYFVTKYSKTSEKEDRAEIFTEIMIFKDKPEYLYAGSNINKKAQFIIKTMTDNLKNNSNSKFYWDRF